MGNPHIFCLALYSNLQGNRKKKLPRTYFWNCGLEYIKQKNVFDGLVLDIIKEIDGDKIILKCLQMDRYIEGRSDGTGQKVIKEQIFTFRSGD